MVLLFALGLMLFIIEQYIEPIVENSIGPLRNMVGGRVGGAALGWRWGGVASSPRSG